jgi:hypothetical protein
MKITIVCVLLFSGISCAIVGRLLHGGRGRYAGEEEKKTMAERPIDWDEWKLNNTYGEWRGEERNSSSASPPRPQNQSFFIDYHYNASILQRPYNVSLFQSQSPTNMPCQRGYHMSQGGYCIPRQHWSQHDLLIIFLSVILFLVLILVALALFRFLRRRYRWILRRFFGYENVTCEPLTYYRHITGQNYRIEHGHDCKCSRVIIPNSAVNVNPNNSIHNNIPLMRELNRTTN